ncbi:MAG TPA: hypothetical protein VM511_06090 [Luteolibacter sp.]|nr:hypothetical protein [Luteolibacter sp.]
MKSSSEIDTQETPAEVLERMTSDAGERCQFACHRAKEIVTRNPIPTICGALVFGAAVGYLVYSRRGQLSLSERLVKDAGSFRRALGSGSDRLSSLLHDGFDAASQRARQASGYLHDLPTDDVVHSVSDSLQRLRDRIKFW